MADGYNKNDAVPELGTGHLHGEDNRFAVAVLGSCKRYSSLYDSNIRGVHASAKRLRGRRARSF